MHLVGYLYEVYHDARSLEHKLHYKQPSIILVLLGPDATATMILRHVAVYTATNPHGVTTMKNRSFNSTAICT